MDSNFPVSQAITTQFAAVLGGAEDLESLTRPMLEMLQAVTGLESTYLTTVNEAEGTQRILYSRNTEKMQIPEGLVVPWGDTLCRRALEEGKPFTDDVGGCWGDSDAARALGITTYMSQAVRTNDGALYGTLCGASASKKAVPSNVVNMFTMFANLIAQQVEREKQLQNMRRTNAELAQASLTDALTGVVNRRGMEQKLGRMLSRAQRDGSRVTVAFVDLDGFKAINDTHGHEIGDRFLIHIARTLSLGTRPGDVVCRTGGDEFVVLAALAQPEELRARLAEATIGPFTHGDVTIDYKGASVGVATSQPGETQTAPVLQRADAAMYEVKKARKAQRVA